MPEGACVLLTGRAGAGKQTVGQGMAAELRRRARAVAVLDAAGVSAFLAPGIDALVWCATLLVETGAVAIVTAPIPSRAAREHVRDAIPTLVEVFLDAPAEVCVQRARRASHPDDPYEEPYAADLRVPTHGREPTASVAQAISYLEERGVTISC